MKFKLCLVKTKQYIWLKETVRCKEDIKNIEETPSPVLTDELRKDLFEKTVKMVEQINYEGAGTVEFIYENGKFYFLEMNTRVQVEHPVTEVQTGIDIVKEQLWIAFTGDTALNQSDINPKRSYYRV